MKSYQLSAISRQPSAIIYWVFALTLLMLAVTPVSAQEINPLDECVTDYDAATDYFPEKVTVDVATGFSVEYHPNYKIVTVNTPWPGAEQSLQYALVQCGTPAPEDIGEATIIEVPVKSVVSMSTSFLPHLTNQGLLDKLVGIDTALYTSNSDVLQRVQDKSVIEIGGGGSGQQVNVEALIELEPDLIISQRFYAEETDYPLMQEAGLPVVINADFIDTSPLGVAEWGKFISLFFNTEAIAQATFADVQARYDDLREVATSSDESPSVFAGTPYDGTWYMPGGQSYLAQLLEDANTNYLWKDDESTASLFLDFETVFDTAVDADYWINVNQFWTSLKDAEAEDQRYAGFAAYQSGNVYTNNARTNGNGSSDYYESGYANPDVILADLIKIFHPDLLPDHALYYYQQVPAT